MERIKAEMHLLPDNDKVLAVGNVTIAGFLTVKNVRIMKGKDAPYISMPGEYQNSGWRNTVYAVSSEMQEELKKTIFTAFREAVTQDLGICKEDVKIKIVPISNESKLKGIATLEILGIKVTGIKIFEKAEKGSHELYVSMPQYKTNGRKGEEWHDVVYPTSSLARWNLSGWVLDAYQEQTKKMPEIKEVESEPKETDGILEGGNEKSTEEQEQWIDNVIEQMREQIEANLPLSDEQWDKVIDKVSEYSALSRENPLVIQKLVNFLNAYSDKTEETAIISQEKEYAPTL